MAGTRSRFWRMAVCVGAAGALVCIAWWSHLGLTKVVPETGRNGLMEIPRLVWLLGSGVVVAAVFGLASGRYIGRG